MVKGKDRVDKWLDQKVGSQGGRAVEKQTSREVEPWQEGKTQVSYWLSTTLAEAIHLQAFKDKRSKSAIVEECIRKHLRK